MTRPGAFAEFMSIPAASLIAMPQAMPAATAALTEPAATAWHAIAVSQRALVRPLQECRVLVIGGGAIGMLAALLLGRLGVRSLEVTELNPLRRESVQRHARCATIDPRAQPLAESRYDFVLDAVGAKATRQQALAAVKPGGVSFYQSRELLMTTGPGKIARWRKALFVLLSRIARPATGYFELPPRQVIELGIQLEL